MWKRTKRIPVFSSLEGYSYPSYFQSWLTWRNQLSSEPGVKPYWDLIQPSIPNNKPWTWTKREFIQGLYSKIGSSGEICPQCNGTGMIGVDDGGEHWDMWCMCVITPKVNSWFKRNSEYQATFEPTKIGSFDTSGDRSSLIRGKNAALDFIKDPTRWLILTGPKGTGKTHLLQAIQGAYGPGVSLYVTCAEICDRFMNFKADDFYEYTKILQRAPVLLIDDLGAGYIKAAVNGKTPYLMAKLLTIINFRYANKDSYPTAITTNESQQSLRGDDWTIFGDRLVDNAHNIVPMVAESYRQSKDRK